MLHFANWKTSLIIVVAVLGLFFSSANLVPESFRATVDEWVPYNSLNLGLDLQGGAHVVLEVDKPSLFGNIVESLKGDVRQTLRRQVDGKRIKYTQLRDNGTEVTVRILDADDVSDAVSRLSALAQPIDTGLFAQGNTANDIEVSNDGQKITVKHTDAYVEFRIGQGVQQSIEVIRARIDELGVTEPVIQRQGIERILVQAPGLDDAERLKEIIGKTAKLFFRLLCQDQTDSAPKSTCRAYPDRDNPDFLYQLHIESQSIVDGADLVDAQPTFDQQTNRPIVSFRFNQRGAVKFGKLTQAHVGDRFAIVLDDEVYSAPEIQSPILGGSGIITGQFTIQETNDLALVLRTGALPVELSFEEERTVGPSLGADSIASGKIAGIIGLVAVVVFIIVSYGLFGIFANIALAINISLIVGVLSLLQATLTLPGIAGIVLTIGMAVDANVLIFERIREEVRNGKTPIAAIDTGYARALGTILDANITTFIAAFILFGLGSGPIRGFSVTLGIGIITSVFTAFTLTRMIVAWWVHRARPKEVPI
jgi:protein-export membrane protein SecD